MSNTPTDKEIFERVRAHLLKQNKRAKFANGKGCAYRGADGLQCAVGCLITDEAYTPTCEGPTIENLRVRTPCEWIPAHVESPAGHALAEALNKSGVPARLSTRRMLFDLQGIHDRSDPTIWEHRLSLAYFDSAGQYIGGLSL